MDIPTVTVLLRSDLSDAEIRTGVPEMLLINRNTHEPVPVLHAPNCWHITDNGRATQERTPLLTLPLLLLAEQVLRATGQPSVLDFCRHCVITNRPPN